MNWITLSNDISHCLEFVDPFNCLVRDIPEDNILSFPLNFPHPLPTGLSRYLSCFQNIIKDLEETIRIMKVEFFLTLSGQVLDCLFPWQGLITIFHVSFLYGFSLYLEISWDSHGGLEGPVDMGTGVETSLVIAGPVPGRADLGVLVCSPGPFVDSTVLGGLLAVGVCVSILSAGVVIRMFEGPATAGEPSGNVVCDDLLGSGDLDLNLFHASFGFLRNLDLFDVSSN